MKHGIVLLVTLLLCMQDVQCQRYNFKLSALDFPEGYLGLMPSVQDSAGFIWIRSFNSLIRYNGRQMETPFGIHRGTNPITLGRPFLVVNGIQNDLWIGSEYNGLCRINLTTNQIQNWIHNPDDNESIGGNEIAGIAIDKKGFAWVGSDSLCLNRVDPTTGITKRFYPNIPIPPGERFTARLGQIQLDPKNDQILWVASPYGVFKFDQSNEQFLFFPFSEIHEFFYKPAPIALHLDPNGTVWCEEPKFLVRLDQSQGSWEQIPLKMEKSLKHGWSISDIDDYSEDVLAITTGRDGIYLYDLKSDHKELLDASTGYPLLSLTRGYSRFLKDRTGGFWTNNGERTIIRAVERKTPFKSVYFPTRTFNWQRSYLKMPNRNGLYIGTLEGEGLIEYDFDSKSHIYHRFKNTGLNNGDAFMDDLCFDQDLNVWIGSDIGLLKFSPQSKQIDRIDSWTTSQTKSHDFVKAVLYQNDHIWIGTKNHGLFALDTKTNKPTRWSENHGGMFRDKEITDLISDSEGQLWVGTTSGIISYQPSEDHTQLFDDTLSNIHVTHLAYDAERNDMWVGTFGQGMFRFNLDQNGSIDHYLNDKSQVSNCIFEFTILQDGRIWINADGGTISLDPETGKMVTYAEFGVGRRGSVTQLENGMVISGIKNGFNYYMPNDLEDRGLLPEVYFNSINIANREEAFELAPDYIKSIELRPDERELQIEFDARNFNSNASTEFQYRLIGRDTQWIDLREQTFLNFNNLTANDYQLQLKAINAYGGESAVIKKLDIRVIPPFYQTTWFRGLAIASFLVGCYLLFLWFKHRQRQWQIKETIAYFSNSHYGQNSVDEILWDVARNVISRLGFEDCVVYLVDREQNMLVQKAAFGPKNPSGRNISNQLQIPIHSGIVGAAVASQKTQRIKDTRLDSRYIMDDELRLSELAVPIIHDGEVLGVIDSEHRKKNFFSQKDAEVIEQIAEHCAQKLAQAQAAEEVRRAEHELVQVQKEVAESKLTALQAQMNPHFLYNSLNSINWYILKNKPKEASRYLTKFSKLVRLILDNSKNLTIPLKQELQALELYLELESMRFEDTFEYEIQTVLDDETDDIEIPPLILQPFVENAIWHGLMHKEGKGKLLVQLYPENGHLKCIVQDDGIGRDASQALKQNRNQFHESKGMKLTNDRIRLLHKDFLSDEMIRVIDLQKADGTAAGTRVEVSLPIK